MKNVQFLFTYYFSNSLKYNQTLYKAPLITLQMDLHGWSHCTTQYLLRVDFSHSQVDSPSYPMCRIHRLHDQTQSSHCPNEAASDK